MPYLIQRAIALVALIVLGLLILALGMAVRMTSRGPAFHRATRVRSVSPIHIEYLKNMGVGASM